MLHNPNAAAESAADAAYLAGGNGSFGGSNLANGRDDQAGRINVSTMHDQNGSGGGGAVQFKKGPWTAVEDAILMEHVNTHGEGNWNSVSRSTGLARCGKSCRLRWSNHLRPDLKKGAFSPEEERIIVESHALFGNKWSRMAVLLPGRTDNEIKNYWNTRVKRHQRLGIPLYPSHIQPVHHGPPVKRGLLRRGSHHQCAKPATSAPESFTFQTPVPSPSTPISKPLFPTSSSLSPQHSPLPSPRSTPLQLANHHLHSPRTSNHPIPCSFTFQTQPLINQPTSTPTTPTHISSPSTNAPTNSSLPLFNIPIPTRSPPTLVRSPMCFRRVPSFSLPPITTTNTTTTTIPFSLPMQTFSRSSGAFEREIKEENNRLCSLLAEITHHQQQQQLPSIHNTGFMQQNAQTWINQLQIEFPSTQFVTTSAANATAAKKRKSRDGEEEEEDDGLMFIEDEDDQDKALFDGLPGTWNHFDSFSQCPGSLTIIATELIILSMLCSGH